MTESMVDAEGDNVNVKALKKENKSLVEKIETKCKEYKHLKGKFDNTKKEKNILSVALKASNEDIKEQNIEMKKTELEKKLIELNDFKKVKVEEQRQQKLAKRKELIEILWLKMLSILMLIKLKKKKV